MWIFWSNGPQTWSSFFFFGYKSSFFLFACSFNFFSCQHQIWLSIQHFHIAPKCGGKFLFFIFLIFCQICIYPAKDHAIWFPCLLFLIKCCKWWLMRMKSSSMVNPPRYGVFKFMAHEIEDNDNGVWRWTQI
jgi:hypothetical protein